MRLSPGERLGPYQLDSLLGRGSMGEVYRAHDPRLGRAVAIKVLPEHAARDPEASRRFEREARAVAALSHPNVLVIHDFGVGHGTLYIVTELLEGTTLRARLAAGRLPWSEAVAHGAAIADGLAAAHGKGVIHRDLKPENLFLTDDDRIKILDFGLAFVREGPLAAMTSPQAGTMLGTFGYVSPEQAAGHGVDHRTDLFALGSVLHEMLTGERAFPTPTLATAITAVLRDEPPAPSSRVDDLPAGLDAIVARCLRKDRDERFHTARDVAFALRSLSAPSPGEATAAEPTTAALGPLGALAVLPFTDAGGRSDGDYLSDGITESVIRMLSRRHDLRIIAWSTVSRFKGTPREPQAIGRELAVDAVVTGGVIERAGRLVVSAELVDTAHGTHLWGARFDRRVTDIFAVQDELAREIAETLQLEVRGEALPTPPQANATRPEVYKRYLKGRYLWNQRSRKSLELSRAYYRRAITADPGYARAWVGLADTYNVLPFWGLAPPREAFPESLEALGRALALAPDLAEAHASRAYVSFYFERDYGAARHGFARALQLDPGYATAGHWFGVCAALRREFDTAFAQLERAQDLDPLSLMINADLALCWYFRGEYEHALEQTANVLDLEPGFVPALLYRGLALEQLGRHPEAIALLRQASERSEGSTLAQAALGHALAAAGQRAEAGEILLALSAASQRRYVSNYPLAVIYAGLGEPETAFAWLGRAADERSEMLAWLEVDPRLAALRDDPRFERLAAVLARPAAGEEPTVAY